MRSATKKDSNRNRSVALHSRFGHLPRREKHHRALNFLIIIGIVLCSTNALCGETANLRGVQIKLRDGNRICMSFEGEIRSIIVNGNVNLPGETFKNITKVGNTRISRSHSGRLTRIGRIGIHRNWRGNIIKIGDAKILRDKRGSVIAVNDDPHVSPLFAIDPPR